MLGGQDLVIGLVIAVFLFGAKKLPELAGSLGKSMKEFRKATESGTETPSPPVTVAQPTLPSRTCASCQTPLVAEWAHCPKCGTAVTPPSTPTA